MAKHATKRKLEEKIAAASGSTATGRPTQATNDDDDDDIVQTQETVSYADPITKRRIEDPVRNCHCGHLYDRSTIVQMVANKRGRIRCPIPGCSNEVFVAEEDLQEDHEAKKAIAELERMERKRKTRR